MHPHLPNKRRTLRRAYWAALIIASLLVVLVYMLSATKSTQARPNYSANAPDAVAAVYPNLGIFSSATDNCLLCHTVQAGPSSSTCRQKAKSDVVKTNCKLTPYGLQLSEDSFRKKVNGGSVLGLKGDPADLGQMQTAIENVKGDDADGDGFSNDEELLVNLSPIDDKKFPDIKVVLTVDQASPIEVIKGDDLDLTFTIKNSSKENIPLNASLVVVKGGGVEVNDCRFTSSAKVEQGDPGVDKQCSLTVNDNMTLSAKATLTADGGATTKPDLLSIEIKAITPSVAVRPVGVGSPVAREEPFELSANVENRTGRDLPAVEITVEQVGKSPTSCQTIELIKEASKDVVCEVTADSIGVQPYKIVASVNGNEVNAGEIQVDVQEREPAIAITTAPAEIMAPIGTEATFDVQVVNSGNVALSDITLKNQRIPTCNQTAGSLAVGEQAQISCRVLVTGDMVEIHDGRFVFLSEVIVDGKETHDNNRPLESQRTIVEIDATRRVLLPVIRSSAEGEVAQVDLIVRALNVTTNTAAVQIQNIGPDVLAMDSAFWVDLYIDPDTPPTGVNQTADDFNGQGLIWGVVLERPLTPQGRLDLRVGDQYFDPDRSRVPATIAAGTPIYVQADSANANTSYGGVLETHEQNGGFYNNIISDTLSFPVSTLTWPVIRGASGDNAGNNAHLPSRDTPN